MTQKQISSPQKDSSPKPAAAEIDTAIQKARDLSRRMEVRFTRIREHVYRALLSADRPVGAYDILDTLDGVGAQKPPTVYRALDWLMEMGLAQRIASLSKYVATPLDPSAEPLAFLLCRECGQAETLDAGPVTALLHQAARQTGFTTEDTVIEITGLCEGHRAPLPAHAHKRTASP